MESLCAAGLIVGVIYGLALISPWLAGFGILWALIAAGQD